MREKKVWLVTGAGRGMGVDIAKAALAAGHAVVATGRNSDKVGSALGAHDDLLAVKLDVTDPADAELAARAAVDRFGRIDVLINNAGNFYAGFFEEISPEDFRAQFETTLFCPMNVTRAVLPVMRAQRSGLLVAISSIAGRVAWNGYGVYNFTKFGVNGFTESLRQEVTRRHVRVGVIEPGGVATELGSHNKPEIGNEMIDPFYEQTQVLAPEDIADGIAYMVTHPRHAAIGELWIMPTDQV